MGRVAYILRIMAGFLMAISVLLAAVSFSDTADNLGHPGGERMFGALMLAAFACFVIAFLAGGMLWVLTDISEQLSSPGPKSAEDQLGAIRERLNQKLAAKS
jgi:hypothetical protein